MKVKAEENTCIKYQYVVIVTNILTSLFNSHFHLMILELIMLSHYEQIHIGPEMVWLFFYSS